MKKIVLTLLLNFSLTAFAQSTCTTHNPDNGLRPTIVRISTSQGGGPCTVMDNDMGTHWAAQNSATINQTLTFEFDRIMAFDQIQIAVTNSVDYSTSFDIQISNDLSSWSDVLSNVSTSKQPLGLQDFDLGSQNAQYLRFVSLGTDRYTYTGSNYWFGVVEFRIVDTSGGGGFVDGNSGESLWSTNTNGVHYNSGNVGIGVDLPGEKLEVDGQIHAREVKVDVNFPAPDYVFYEDYKLKTLEELQHYITENGHLPDIPSAKEIEANGIELGLMNMKLLEKIEELTLYLINQEQRLNQQEIEIRELSKNLKF